MTVVSPGDILDQTGTPRWLQLEALPVSVLARDHNLAHQGADVAVRSVVPLSSLLPGRSALTYLSSAAYAPALNGVTRQAVVTTAALAALVPRENGVLLTDGNPREVFYSVLARLVRADRFESLRHYISPSARIHPSASIAQGVHIDDDVVIGPHAAVLRNTYVGKRAVLKPNCTLGGDGFEAAVVDGRRQIVPHAGGVWIGDGVQIGSSTCIDKGLWGDFTFLGAETMVDNLVHFSHSAACGRRCSLVACCEISGSAWLGDGVWIGPNASVNQSLRIGDYSYVGTASVVTRDLPARSLAYGSPAKVMASVCDCRGKLVFTGDDAICSLCGARFVRTAEGVRHAG